MNKLIYVLFACVLVLFTNCKDNDDDKPKPNPYSIVGTWVPYQKVVTDVDSNNNPTSKQYIYTDCQKQGRFVFDELGKGRKTEWEEFGGNCTKDFDKVYNYTFDNVSMAIKLDFKTYEENGKILSLDDKSMKLKVEKIVNNQYHSEVYSLTKQ